MSFKDIKGHNQAIFLLKQDLEQERLAASYLFLGPDGIGKAKTALTLAKALNCQNNQLDSCDTCASCLKIDSGNHPDIHLIGSDGEENIKIEEIRNVKRQIGLRPYEARRKVVIIDNAHLLSAEASNALLKMLEEPPANAVIILTSSRLSLLFKTIVSRCRMIRFYPMVRQDLSQILRQDHHLDEKKAHFLAYFCEGRYGYGFKLKDTDIFKEKNKIIDEISLSFKPIAGAERKDVLKKQLNILASWFRDIYMLKIGLAQSEVIHVDRLAELVTMSRNYDFIRLDNIVNFIGDSLRYLEENINPKLLISNLRMELAKV